MKIKTDIKLVDIEDAGNWLCDRMEPEDFGPIAGKKSLWFTKVGRREGMLTLSRMRPAGFHPSLSVRVCKHPEWECRTWDEREAVLKAWGKRHGMEA